MKKNETIKLFILTSLTSLAYLPTLIWMVGRFSAKDSYYSHGFLVPLVSVFLVWKMRDKLKKIKPQPSALGWIFFLGGIAIHVISALLRVYFTSGFSLLAVIVGLVLLFWGKAYLKALWFPIAFLIFMLPLPLVAIVNLSFKLKIFAATVSTWIVNSLGIEAIREGSVIRTHHSYLMVEDPCSGIRSLIALIALGALMAYFLDAAKIKKAALFLVSIPIAIASNVIRITALSMASEMYGAQFATGKFHDIMGILVFVFAFIGMSLVAKVLE